MKSVVDSLQAINPKMKLVPSCIAPRGDEESYDINRQELNLRLLKEYSLNPAVTLCDNNNLANHGRIIHKFYAVDKIHLNEEGSSVLASNISSTLKYMMGIDIKRHYSPKKGNRDGHNYHGGSNRNHGGGNGNRGGGNCNQGGGNRNHGGGYRNRGGGNHNGYHNPNGYNKRNRQSGDN